MAGEIDVYPVGLLRDLRQFRRGIHRPHAVSRLRHSLAFPFHVARDGNWRAAKNYFNGYLAEPREFPPGVKRCGTGWTQRRARRDLARLIRAGERA